MSNGKVQIVLNSPEKLEGIFYWPVAMQCTENDMHSIMDLFIIWRFIGAETDLSDESKELFSTINANLDSVAEKWIKIKTNCWLQDEVSFYSKQFFKVMLTKIWKSGLDVSLIRQYYPQLFKCARDIEEFSGMGFKKLYYARIVIIPTTIEVDGILRKRPISYYAVTAIILSRKNATIALLKDFIDTKEQVRAKEESIFLSFLEILL